MKKNIMSAVIALGLTVSAQAGEWEFLPVLNSDYTPQFALALTGGVLQGDASSTESVFGVEISLDCPLLKAPNHTIRQQASFTKYDHNGEKLSSFELNPHHMFEMTDNTYIGVGPSLGFAKYERAGDSDTVFTYGLGLSLRTNFTEHFFVGAEMRYVWTQDANINGVEDDVNNLRTVAKIGYQF
jgi:opacity protein-like surface antigen